MLKNPNYSAAIKYLKECAFSVIPVKPDKKPCIKWEEFQKRLPTEQEVKDWWNKFPDANVGIVTGLVSGLAVIDLDEPDAAKEALKDLIPDSLVFPVAKTPRGGEHWYFKCSNGNLSNNSRLVTGCDFRANGGYVVAPPSVGTNGKKYAWTNNMTPANTALPYIPVSYLSCIKESLYIKNSENMQVARTTRVTLFSEGTRDNDLFHVANCLTKGGMKQENALQVLEILAKNCNPPFPLDEINDKVLSAIKRKEHKEINLTLEIEAFLSVTNGAFSVTDCNNSLLPVTGVTNRNSIRVILNRLMHKGLIKKYGDKDGWYIRVEDKPEAINWWDAPIETLNIKYPFEIEDYVLTFPKNIIVVAGTQNAGKSTFCMNFAKLNIPLNMPIIYCSSEMSPSELKMRLGKFEDVQTSIWRKVQFIERSSDFVDIINPNGINIIDYMEITDNFYRIAQYIKEIHDKLDKGICLIAIQKDRKSDYGRGGAFGLEKPKLYINMEHGKMTIVKAKSFRDPTVNPNGLTLDFKIYNGAKFLLTHGWHKKEEANMGKEWSR